MKNKIILINKNGEQLYISKPLNDFQKNHLSGISFFAACSRASARLPASSAQMLI